MSEEVQNTPPGRYRHYKGGEYEVVGDARHSETEERLVVYRSLADGRLWVRPVKMFLDHVCHEGRTVRRFAPEGITADGMRLAGWTGNDYDQFYYPNLSSHYVQHLPEYGLWLWGDNTLMRRPVLLAGMADVAARLREASKGSAP